MGIGRYQVGAEPLVYFARAVDGRDREVVLAEGRDATQAASSAGLALWDPVAVWDARAESRTARDGSVRDLVEADLAMLRKADGVLMDMTLPGHRYIGCVCELTYASLWHIPCVVWVADTGLEHRAWLRYHAAAIVRERTEAIATLAALLADRGTGGSRRRVGLGYADLDQQQDDWYSHAEGELPPADDIQDCEQPSSDGDQGEEDGRPPTACPSAPAVTE
jgi:hypothetical protein